eukprot:jgi/Astpho2/8276/Aster-x0350
MSCYLSPMLQVSGDWQQVVEHPEVDAVVIGTWPYLHHTLVLAALKANKHVLTEARMAMNLQEAKEMLAESRRHPHLITQIVPSPITLPYDSSIQDIIGSGQLGDILHVEVRAVTGKFAQKAGSEMTWRQDASLSGLNTMTMGIYYEVLQRCAVAKDRAFAGMGCWGG